MADKQHMDDLDDTDALPDGRREAAVRRSPRKAVEAEAKRQPVRPPVPDTDSWRNPQTMQEPEARSGYKQRWIYCAPNEHGQRNMARRRYEGWAPRDPSTVPDAELIWPTIKGAAGVDVIRVGFMELWEMPLQAAKQREEHFRRLAQRSQGIVDPADAGELAKGNKLLAATGAKPMSTELHERVVLGRGRRPATMAD